MYLKDYPDYCNSDIVVFDDICACGGVCDIAILRNNKKARTDICGISVQTVLSCGIGGKSTLTASGLTDQTVILCVQREILVGEKTIEAQDVPIKCGEYRDEFRAIAAAAALLISGAEYY